MESSKKKPPSDWVSSTESLLATVVIAVFIITFVVQAFQIPSESMEDTLLIGDYLLVDKLHYGGRAQNFRSMPYQSVKHGDIIVFKYPVDPRQHFVKRVIAVPGDRVRLANQQVFVNGMPLQEPYAHYAARIHNQLWDKFPQLESPMPGMEGDWWIALKKLVDDDQLIVPEGKYFVLGDNRDDSADSRYWGFVPRENIIGRPLLIYWSLRESSPDLPKSPTPNDKIFHFVYAVTHIVQITRWERTFRLVN